MASPAMPDPARTARAAVRVVESMGVPPEVMYGVAVDVLADTAGKLVDAGAGDLQWLYDVARELGRLRDDGYRAITRPMGEPPETLVSAMDSLGYTWSVELGRFTGGSGDEDFHDRCPRCPRCGRHRHGGDCA